MKNLESPMNDLQLMVSFAKDDTTPRAALLAIHDRITAQWRANKSDPICQDMVMASQALMQVHGPNCSHAKITELKECFERLHVSLDSYLKDQ